MTTKGWNVALFWNGCVLQDRERVLQTLVDVVEGRLTEEVRSFDFTFLPARNSAL